MATVLVVTNLSLAEKRVEEAMEQGDRVILAENASSAEKIARTDGFDLAVLDDDMPSGDGERTLTRIRSVGSRVPVIMFSDHSDSGRVVRCFELGADDYVEFPVSAALLRARIHVVMRRAGSARG